MARGLVRLPEIDDLEMKGPTFRARVDQFDHNFLFYVNPILFLCFGTCITFSILANDFEIDRFWNK